jgi:hypothetical protein
MGGRAVLLRREGSVTNVKAAAIREFGGQFGKIVLQVSR